MDLRRGFSFIFQFYVNEGYLKLYLMKCEVLKCYLEEYLILGVCHQTCYLLQIARLLVLLLHIQY